MICNNCKKENREGSRFCQHCGTPLSAPAAEPEVVPVVAPVAEPVPPVVEEPVAAPVEEPVAAPVEEPAAAPVEEPVAEEPAPVVIPVAAEPAKPQKEKKPKKEKAPKGKKPVGLIILSVLMILLFLASAGLNVYQYFNHKQLQTTIDEKDAQIVQLNKQATDLAGERDDLEQQLADANNAIENLQGEIDEMTTSMNAEAEVLDAYYRLFDSLVYNDLGYYSDEFCAEYFLLPMTVGEEFTFMLTTDWEGAGTVDVTTDNDGASVDFAQSSWSTEVGIDVVAHEPGVTIATFTWEEQGASFDVIILVVEE